MSKTPNKSRRLVLGVGVLGGSAALLVGGVLAAFTGTVATSPQTITSGNVPGDSNIRYVTVNNDGNIAWATSTVKATNTGGVLVTDTNGVKVEIKSCPTAYNTSTGACAAGEATVFASSSPSGLTTARTLTTVAPGSALHLKLTTSLPTAATNTVANTSTSLTYTVDVTQRAAVTTNS
jgi:hypothetical protein